MIYLDYISIAIYLTISYYVMRSSRFLALSLFFLIFSYGWLFISNIYLGHSHYMSELSKMSYHNNSTAIGVLFFIPFILGVYLSKFFFFERDASKILPKFSKKSENYMFLIFFTLLLILITHAAASINIFNSQGENLNIRFNFWTDFAIIPQLQVIQNQIPSLTFAAAIFFKDWKKLITILALSILSYIFIGQKFSALMIVFTLFLIGIYLARKTNPIKNIKLSYIFVLLLLIYIIVQFSLYHYREIEGRENAMEFLLSRVLALQGQLLWASTEFLFSDIKLSLTDFPLDGMDFLMKYFAPFKTYTSYTDSNVTFTMGYLPLLIMFFGLSSLFLQFAIGFAYGFIFSLIIKISTKNFISAFLISKIIISLFSFLTLGNLDYILSFKVVLIISIIALYNILTRPKHKSQTLNYR